MTVFNWIKCSDAPPPKDREIYVKGGEVTEWSGYGAEGSYKNNEPHKMIYRLSEWGQDEYYQYIIGACHKTMKEPEYWSEIEKEHIN